jgi:hydrogenase expression/formation protein HypE
MGLLEGTVLRLTGEPSRKILTGPQAGVDFAAIKAGDRYLLVSADPITGVSDGIGTYAVRVSANDVATSGNRAQFAESVVLLPEGSSVGDLERMARQIHDAAKKSKISILGGHTEVTPGLRHPIVVITAFSLVRKFVTSAGAKDGDSILMTKTAGIEGTSELALNRGLKGKVGAATLKRAREMIDEIDVSKEAVAAFRTGVVHAMHDCTEGGVLGAAFEMSVASGVGFRLRREAVAVSRETKEICRELSVDPLRLIGSGSLLIAVPGGKEGVVERALRPICRVSRIGEFRREGRTLLSRGKEVPVAEAPEDELWRVLSRPGSRL